MADRRDAIRQDLEALVKEGERLHLLEHIRDALEHRPEGIEGLDAKIKEEAQEFMLSARYQRWYSKALRVVEQLVPDRLIEFQELYRLPKPPKELDLTTYSISNYLNGVVVRRGYEEAFSPFSVFNQRLSDQISIVRSAKDRLDSLLSDITGVLEAELLDDELSVADELRRKKHLRASGVVSGVVLERHLKRVAANHGVKLRKKAPTIGDLNDALKSAAVYDVSQWRQIQRYGDIRNYAGHDKERDPTAEEIQELHDGVDRLVKSLF